MAHSRLEFHRGDAFRFELDRRVDWLLCDVIAAPERSIELLLRWLRKRLAARFVVTIKFKGTGDYAMLEPLKHALPSLCQEVYLMRLSANKNEVCAFGSCLDQP
jgi:23S rRNA (cytidine2498-2'-O)-methyltransferase